MAEVQVAPEEAPADNVSEGEVEYVCPPEFDEKEELCKMFVGGLDKDSTDEEFRGMFEKFGTIKTAVVMKRSESRSERLFGFITFAKCDHLDDCLLERPFKYKDRELDIKRAIPKGVNEGTGHYKVKKLHIGNVPAQIDTNNLLKYFKSRHPTKYGTIEDIDIFKTKDESGKEKNRGFGFITVSSEDFADRISIAESNFLLDGNTFRISKARPKAADGGPPKRGFKGEGQSSRGGNQGGGWSNRGYDRYGDSHGYGYGNNYGYGGGYYDYGYHTRPSYGAPPPAQGARRYAPY